MMAMGGVDWADEARRLLASAAGTNDNKGRPQASPTIIFQAPVTVLNLTVESSASPEAQRHTLIHRLEDALSGEGDKVWEAFRGELRRAFGKDSVAALPDGQLADLVVSFNTMLRFARLLAGTPQR